MDELEEEDNPIDQPTTTQPISSFDDNEKEMEEEGDSEDADSNEDEKVWILTSILSSYFKIYNNMCQELLHIS